MIPRRPFPEISLDPPPVTAANFDAPQMPAPQQPQSNLAGQVNQLGQLFKLGQYRSAGSMGGIGGGLGKMLGGK